MASLVVLCFFPAFNPARSGGELRLGKVYRAISRDHDVAMVTSTDFGARYEEIVHAPRFKEYRVPKDELWQNAYATLERSGVKGELSGLAFALAVSDPACRLRTIAKELSKTADFVVHEFPFSEPIFNDGCACPEIYNSHNFETSLLSAVVHGDGFEAAQLKLMRLEGNLVARAHRVFSTSETDSEKFRLFFGADPSKLAVCPNGIDYQELQAVAQGRLTRDQLRVGRPRLIFTGSGHNPNVEAGRFIAQLAEQLPECDIVLAGGMCSALSADERPSNIQLFGPFDDAAKVRLLTEADIYLNPVIVGSGTSLKALEALGAAIPMVSTSEGVRGLGVIAGVHCEVLPREEFARGIKELLRDPGRMARLAAEGQRYAQAKFSWTQIASRFAQVLASPVEPSQGARPCVLALNDYSVMQPGSGGVARVRNLLMNIGCDVILLSFAPSFDVGLIGPGVLHVTVPKSAAHRAFEDAVNDRQPMSVNDAVASLFVASNRLMVNIASAIALRAQAAIFEHPYLAPLLDAIRSVRNDLPIVYSAHNIEGTHKAEILEEHTIGVTLTQYIGELESRLAAASQLIVCCTEADAKHFSTWCVDTIVVPNGCTVPDTANSRKTEANGAKTSSATIGFLGSGHGPNVEAAEFIIDHLAPFFPDAKFEMVGTVCYALKEPPPTNVVLHGMLSESRKSVVMGSWDVALNPIQSGGGSSLKLPDYLAHGLATLSTPAGARSFAVAEHRAGSIVPRGNFRSALARLLGDRATIKEQGINGHRYATQHLSWHAITAEYRDRLGKLFKDPGKLKQKRLLVVTYRYTEPALGGAEEYLIEVLKRLRPRFDRIDLAAIDVNQLTNHHHFGCRMSSVEGGAARRIGEIFDQALYFAPDLVPESVVLDSARDLERAWSLEQFSLFSSFVHQLAVPDRLRLFAGFFWPENQNGVVRRWTSPRFSFLVPASGRVFQMKGYAAEEKKMTARLIRLTENGQELVARFDSTISPHFELNIAIPTLTGNAPIILDIIVDEHQAPNDHRPLGVLLDSASVVMDCHGTLSSASGEMSAVEVSVADLNDLHEEELRVNQSEAWMHTLHEIALHRDSSMEDDFATVRGPHSVDMQVWLAHHATNYDAILVQGIPFDVLPRTVERLSSLPDRPALITLPHFHGDDRFYHWRRYYDSFAQADATLVFSSSIAENLGPAAKCVVVPGGGVRADECAIGDSERHFRDLYQDADPFFLVLGRKTASKGYILALQAHQKLRRSGAKVGLVLIGPDEDGLPIAGEGVHYLGRQPREVIRGALSSCVGLVTMSRSESFGIVLCEAWLFGKPVIANRTCYSFRELIKDDETGLLVSNVDELTAAMRHLVDNENEGLRMGNAGFTDTINRFTWDNVASSCMDALAESR